MKLLANYAVAAAVAAGALMGASAPANAAVGLSISVGGPFYYGGYDYRRPCSFYRRYDLPAPRRCLGYFRNYYGSAVYLDGDFVFGSQNVFYRWRDHDDYRRWRNHEYREWRHHDRDRDGVPNRKDDHPNNPWKN